MVYEPPAVQYHGALSDILRGLFPRLRKRRPGMDRRIELILHSIDSHKGSIGWDLDHACREVRLDISSAHAARLFKRHTGLGVREYARKKRLLMAAQRLKTTDRSVKEIAQDKWQHGVALRPSSQELRTTYSVRVLAPIADSECHRRSETSWPSA